MKLSIKEAGSSLSKKGCRSICERREWSNNSMSSAYIKPGFSGVLKKKNWGKKIKKIIILVLSCTAWQHVGGYKEKWAKSHIHVILSCHTVYQIHT